MSEPGGASAPGPEVEGALSGSGFDRVVAFSDGVFAIAITLLVLTIEVPDVSSAGGLDSALRALDDQFLSYAIGFAVVGLLWLGHHRFFEDLRTCDRALMVMNVAYLAFICLMPFSTGLIGEYPDTETSMIFFALNLTAAGVIDLMMTGYALRRRLFPVATVARGSWVIAATAVPPVVFAASVPLILVTPHAPWLWLAIIAGERFIDRYQPAD